MKKTLSLILSMLMLLSVFSVAALAAEAPALKALKCTFDGVELKWSAVKDAANYIVYRSDSANDEGVIATTTKTTYVDKTVKEGVKYTYKVTVQTKDGKFTTPDSVKSRSIVYKEPDCDHADAKWVVDTAATVFASGEKHKVCPTCKKVLGKKVIDQLKPAAPKLSKVYNGKLGVGLKWNVIDGATSYNVYRKGKSNEWKKIATLTKTSYVDKTVKSGVLYKYIVRARNAAGLSAYEKASVIRYLAMPQNVLPENKADGIRLTWDKVKGATSYKIYCKLPGEAKWDYIATTKKTSYSDLVVLSGETYVYSVKAVAGDYASRFDYIGVAITRLDNPVLSKAKSNKEGIIVSWEAVTGAAGYNVYRKTANSSWTLIGKVNNTRSTAYLDKSVKKGVTYTYTVRARNNTSISSFDTNGISCKDRY